MHLSSFQSPDFGFISHDFLGRSAARGSFLLWTHNMKNITVHPTFTPSGAPASETYAYGKLDRSYYRQYLTPLADQQL